MDEGQLSPPDLVNREGDRGVRCGGREQMVCGAKRPPNGPMRNEAVPRQEPPLAPARRPGEVPSAMGRVCEDAKFAIFAWYLSRTIRIGKRLRGNGHSLQDLRSGASAADLQKTIRCRSAAK